MERQDAEEKVRSSADAYLAMLVVSVGAMMVGSALLFVHYQRYSEKSPELPATPRASTR
jgi:hypothetical protein